MPFTMVTAIDALPGPSPAVMPRAVRRLETLAGAVLLALALVTGPAAATTTPATSPALVADSARGTTDDAAGAEAAASPLEQLRENFTAENRTYSDIKTAVRFISPIWAIIAALVVLFSGLSARMRDIAHAMGRARYVRVLVYLVLFTLAMFALMFPLAWYDDFALEHQYQLSNQTFPGWLGDQWKSIAISTVLLGLIPLLAFVYWVIEKSPRRWWLWLGLGSLPIIVFSLLIAPVFIAPVFNKFTRLEDKQLERRILDLAARADIPGRNVYVVNKSEQTKKYNAYVSGFGASQRIVLYDTTVQGMREDEILYVMGHEMGHYALGHVWRGIVVSSAICLTMFFLAGGVARWALRRYGPAWGVRELHDVGSMPLLYAALTVVTFLVVPAFHAYTRSVETEADLYGLELTHDNEAAARAFVKLGSNNKSNPEPSPIVKLMLYSHPPDGERVRRALSYHPWAEGRPNRYYKDKGPS